MEATEAADITQIESDEQAFSSWGGFLPQLQRDDLRLLHALQIAPRAPWLDLGKILDAHPATLARRWERLRSSGVAWITAHLRPDPAHTVLTFVDVDCTPGERDLAIAALSAMPAVQTVEVAAGQPDLMLTVFTRSLMECGEVILPRIAKASGVSQVRTHLCTRLYTGGQMWRLTALSRTQAAAVSKLDRSESIPGRLPPGCLDLLPILARNGRATAAEIARELGRSAATAHRQLSRVLGSSLLTFRCEVAQNHAGYPVLCSWLANVPPGQHSAAAAAAGGLRNVRLIASTTGQTNFMIMMWLRTMADVMTAELALQEKIPGIQFVQSTVMLRTVKRVGIMLRPDGTATGDVVAPPSLVEPIYPSSDSRRGAERP